MAKSKADLVSEIQVKCSDLTRKQVTGVVDALLQSLTNALVAGEDVSLPGFGKFGTSKRAARTGRNPATGATMQIPESTVPKFNPSKALKDAVAKK